MAQTSSPRAIAHSGKPRGFSAPNAFVVPLVAAVGLLYWRTAARDIVVGDTPELITAAASLGVMHPSGYPLVTLLGHLLSQLPLGPLPFRVNLLSVCCGAATAGLIYLTSLRLTGRIAPSAAAALLLATSPLFWEWSLAAEVFAPNNLLAAAFCHALVAWHLRPERSGWLCGAALLAGLGLANHLTFVLLAPAAGWLLWLHRDRLRPRLLLVCAGLVLFGLMPYAYLPWAAARHPYLNWGAISTPGELLDHVLRSSYGTGRLVIGPHAGGSPVERIGALLAALGPLPAALAIAGAVAAWLRVRWYLAFAAIAFVVSGPVFVAVANMNLVTPQTRWVFERFFVLPVVVVAPLGALGIALLGDALAGSNESRRRSVCRLLSAVVIAAAAVGVSLRFDRLDLSGNHVARQYGEDILSSLEPDSILLGGGDESLLPLAYLQAVERQRPDVTLVMLPLLGADWYVHELRRRHPDLVLEFDRHTSRSPTMLTIVEANRERPIAIVGDVLDPSLRGKYWFYRHGLVARILPVSQDVMLSQMVRDNESLWRGFRPPSHRTIRARTFEYGILLRYASPALTIAAEFEKAGRLAEAREWNQRAAAVAPDFDPVRARLGSDEPARRTPSP